MRIRSIKPEFWQSETIGSVDPFSRLMAIALLNLSDDHGYFNATPAVVRGEVFPFEESLARVSRALEELSRIGYIRIGTTAGQKRVGNVVNFKAHQKVDHPSRLAFDVDSIIWDGETREPSRDSREASPSPRESLDKEQGAGSREHGEGSKGARVRRTPFSQDEFDHLLSPAMRASPEFMDSWHLWCTFRKSKGNRISEIAAKTQIKGLHAAGIPASIAAITKSIANDYAGLFPETSNGSRAPSTSVGRVPTFEEIRHTLPKLPGPGPRKGLADLEAEFGAQGLTDA